ncbi:MAG: hypothetical protein U0V75_13265 [Ferruginibacter sp.]
MKFFVSFILTALLSFAACLYFPWWSIAIAAFAVAALIPQGAAKSFLTGFTALFLLWGALSWWISNANGHMLAHKVSVVLLKTDNPWILIFATALIGGLTAGLAALSGSFLRKGKS